MPRSWVSKLDDDTPLIGRAVDALGEHGDGFTISASHGLVVLPDEARDAAEALRLADERMYTRKRGRRAGHRGQARDVLVQVLAERGARDSGVASLAGEVGRPAGSLRARALRRHRLPRRANRRGDPARRSRHQRLPRRAGRRAADR